MSIKKIIKRLKTKLSDGSLSNDIPIGADAENVFFTSGHTLDEVVGNIDIDTDGDIATQLANGGGGGSSERCLIFSSLTNLKTRYNVRGETVEVKSNDILQTLGYYSVGDGGQGKYRVSTTSTTTDEGSVVAITMPTGENTLYAYLMPENNSVNVLQFGAAQINTADSAPAIQKAITFCQGKGYKLVIPVPSGTKKYVIKTPISITKSIHIEGSFPYASTNQIEVDSSFSGTNGVINITGNSGSSVSTMIKIEKLKIKNTDVQKPFFYITNTSSTGNISTQHCIELNDIGIYAASPQLSVNDNTKHLVCNNLKITGTGTNNATISLTKNIELAVFYNCYLGLRKLTTTSNWLNITEDASTNAFFYNCIFSSVATKSSYETSHTDRFINCSYLENVNP